MIIIRLYLILMGLYLLNSVINAYGMFGPSKFSIDQISQIIFFACYFACGVLMIFPPVLLSEKFYYGALFIYTAVLISSIVGVIEIVMTSNGIDRIWHIVFNVIMSLFPIYLGLHVLVSAKRDEVMIRWREAARSSW